MILALNETRKTLIASGLQKSHGRISKAAPQESAIAGGGGCWVEGCQQVDASGMRRAFDVLFLDEGSRVIESLSEVRPGAKTPAVAGAVAALELAAGTIRFSQTEKGDRVTIEEVGAEPPCTDSVSKRSRLF